jgi:transposase
MRHELTDCEWDIIRAMLPKKPRGVPRVNDQRSFSKAICRRPTDAIRLATIGSFRWR